MEIKIEKTRTNKGEMIAVTTPFHPDFPSRARSLGGKWSSLRWLFDVRDEERVRDLVKEVYGSDGTEPCNISVKLTATDNHEYRCAPVYCGPIQLARAFGRDSGAKLGEGVLHIGGNKPTSGGSMKNWTTLVKEGCVFEIRDIPRETVELMKEECGWFIEIASEPNEFDELISEKKRLEEQLSIVNSKLAKFDL